MAPSFAQNLPLSLMFRKNAVVFQFLKLKLLMNGKQIENVNFLIS